MDLALALALTAGSQAEIWTAPGMPDRRAAAATTAFATVLLTLRRRVPVLCGGVALTVLLLHQLVMDDVERFSSVTVLAEAVAMYSLGAYAPFRRAVILGGVGVLAFWTAAIAEGKPLGDVLFVTPVLFGPWLAALAIARRRARERVLERHAVDVELEGQERARSAVEEERAHIARELHDVVAHAMSVIVVQAGAERRLLLPEQESTRAVLETIERTGRQALNEMRRLVGMLRLGDEQILLAPQPSLAALPELCEEVQSAGLPVELTFDGPPLPVPPGVDVSAYRIVQEALTNALKHSGAARARVRVSYRPGELAIEVIDDGHGPVSKGPVAAGHGLAGMRERASIYGGEFEAGARLGGGYAVQARLPLDEGPR